MQDQKQKSAAEIDLVYVGTYTGGDSEGIYICRFDMTTGALEPISVVGNVDNPSYLAIDARRLRLYAVNETSSFKGLPGGSVSAFAIQPPSGELSLINRQYSNGGAPCYVNVDDEGRHLFVVNYSGGNVVVFPILDGGAIGEPTDMVAHSGRSLHPERQDGPHPHSIVFDPANNHAFVPDLGLDKIMQYALDRSSGRLYPNQLPWTEVSPGSGPRHIIFTIITNSLMEQRMVAGATAVEINKVSRFD